MQEYVLSIQFNEQPNFLYIESRNGKIYVRGNGTEEQIAFFSAVRQSIKDLDTLNELRGKISRLAVKANIKIEVFVYYPK